MGKGYQKNPHFSLEEALAGFCCRVHNQELTTEELMELLCVSQQEAMAESLPEEEKVTAKQHNSSGIRDTLKAWETVASIITLIRQ
ncbi:hypothetical protein AVEN_247466-1 [Araneus ventricosus]|uniref:Uncharacterized protein n=1 Tax=Araneus ventricosus TaxID=182803 RepID=A0A4Y2J6Z7_ARAVE|nr:hypothetical protein AVEN_247466-1 [Araneus ventricosus]